MPEHEKSYPSGSDIRKEQSQGEMVARLERQQGGIPDEELLEPQKRTARKIKRPRHKAA